VSLYHFSLQLKLWGCGVRSYEFLLRPPSSQHILVWGLPPFRIDDPVVGGVCWGVPE